VRINGVYDDLCVPDRPTQSIALLARVHGQESFTELQRTPTDAEGSFGFDHTLTGTTDFFARNVGTGQSTRTVTIAAGPWDEGCRPHSVTRDRAAIRIGEEVVVTLTSSATSTVFVLNAVSPDRQRRLGGRSDAPGEDGTIRWTLGPTENTRLLVSHGQLCPEDDLGVVTVTPHVSIAATRTGVRDYTFTGRVLPGRGQPVALYRLEADGRRVLSGRSTVRADGTYRFDRRFTGSGRFRFVVASGASRTAAGESAPRSTLIY
jgi:hypothetical protein